MIRLFVALSLPEEVRLRLEGLRGGLPGARWQSAEQMHLTLRFIGEVDGGAFAEIRDALAQIRAEVFTLALEGVGHFPPRGRVRILWAGVVPNPALTHLHERTEAAVTGPRLRARRPQLRAPRHAGALRLQGAGAAAAGLHRLSRPLYERAFPGALLRALLQSSGGGRGAVCRRGELSPRARGGGRRLGRAQRLSRRPRCVPCRHRTGRSGGRSRGSARGAPPPPGCRRSRSSSPAAAGGRGRSCPRPPARRGPRSD